MKKVAKIFFFVAGIGYISRVLINKAKNMILDLNKEMAWVTFMDEGWESVWHPVTDVAGNHLEFDDGIMDHCRKQFNRNDNWVSFGIAPTSQMLLKNSVRDNL